MSRWLNVLCKENIIIHSENGGYKVNSIVAIAYSDTDLWKTMYAVEDKLHYSKKTAGLFKNIQQYASRTNGRKGRSVKFVIS